MSERRKTLDNAEERLGAWLDRVGEAAVQAVQRELRWLWALTGGRTAHTDEEERALAHLEGALEASILRDVRRCREQRPWGEQAGSSGEERAARARRPRGVRS